MELLDFARGPALQISIAILVIGLVWRAIGVFLLGLRKRFSLPRGKHPYRSALLMMAMRSWPHKEFLPKTGFTEFIGYTFHLGYFAVFLLFIPHIEFIKGLIGISWPGLPNGLIYLIGVITVFALVVVLSHRLSSPVLRLISNPDDYLSWLFTVLPLITGFVAAANIGAKYETLLALHILSVELLMIWFPFSKLMHAFFIWPCRAITGAEFDRKGASIQ